MFSNKKHAFWQAFFVAVLVFAVGMVLGVYLEQMRTDSIAIDFYDSEISLYDSYALSSLIDSEEISCDELRDASVTFADKIYEEALLLENYDNSNKITRASKILHKKYDLLRTIYWINIIELRKRCDNINSVVYLYEYETEDVAKTSEQIIWSRILRDLKDEDGERFVLIPIAADQGLVSLNALVHEYKIEEFPVVIINEDIVIYNLRSTENLKEYLN